ncbi:hypothetical protein [Enterococcus phage 47]|nr:hypothetical protein [Enterococcus phage vB_EfaS_Ef2.2]UOX39242.1 hypothetical protein [Enterococcus phage 47]
MTIEQVKDYGKAYGKELSTKEVKEFFEKHNDMPSLMDLAKFCGAMNEDGTKN